MEGASFFIDEKLRLKEARALTPILACRSRRTGPCTGQEVWTCSRAPGPPLLPPPSAPAPGPPHLQEPFGGREAAQAQAKQDPAPGQAARFVVLRELLADLAVNLVPKRHGALGGQAGGWLWGRRGDEAHGHTAPSAPLGADMFAGGPPAPSPPIAFSARPHLPVTSRPTVDPVVSQDCAPSNVSPVGSVAPLLFLFFPIIFIYLFGCAGS